MVCVHNKTLNQQCMLTQAHPPMMNHLTSTWNKASIQADNVTCPLLTFQINNTHLTMLNHYSALVSYTRQKCFNHHSTTAGYLVHLQMLLPPWTSYGISLSSMDILTLHKRLEQIMKNLELYFWKTRLEIKQTALQNLSITLQLTLQLRS